MSVHDDSNEFEYTSLQELMDTEILPILPTSFQYPTIIIVDGNEGLVDTFKSIAGGIKNRFLDIKNILRGIRKSNILFHKSEYGQYRKMNPLRYRKIMAYNDADLKGLSPVYKPADMAVKYRDTSIQVCALVGMLNMPYTAYFLLDKSRDVEKLLKRHNHDTTVYLRMYDEIAQLSKFEDIKVQFPLVMNHYNSGHRNKTNLQYKFSDLFNSANDFRETDTVLGNNHTALKETMKVESVVMTIEKVFDSIIYLVQKSDISDKQTILAISSIADIISVVLSSYGYSISRLNELLHNHVLNLESIGNQIDK